MTIDEPGLSTPVRRTAYAYVPAVAMVVGMANNIFEILGITPGWQQRIVFILLASVPMVLALAWILGKPKSGDGWLARFSKTRSRRFALAALPTLVVAAALVWAVGRLTPDREVGPRVAVVDFRDGSPQHDHAHLASELSVNLREALLQTPGMLVMAAPDSALVIIEGTVSQWKDKLEVVAKLVRNSDKRMLRLVRYKRPAEDLQSVEDSLSQVIITELLPDIQRAQAKGRIGPAHADPRAYDLYLRARYARDHERNVSKADSLFRAALAVDSSFGRARRALSELQAPAP